MGYKREILYPLIKKSRVIVDIGANNGKEAKRFLKLSPKAEIHIFEPNPKWVKYLNEKFEKKSNCHVYNYAISDEDGSANFNLEESGKNKSASLRKTTKLHSAVFKKSIKVPTRRLDTWYKDYKLGIIDFMWTDVEGAERGLITGGIEALKNTRYFYTEYTEKEYLKGQALLPEIMELVSPHFDMVEKFPWFNREKNKSWHFGSILFKNKNL
jgi:2-O-methyltransferase